MATVALGVAVALTRAQEARAPRRLRATRRLGLGAQEPPLAGIRRMALEQADLVIDELGDAAAGVHEARKAIKRLRAIVRLLEGEIGARAAAREQDALRSAAALLAGARDAEVMLATLDAVLGRGGRKLARRAGAISLRLALVGERERHSREALAPANLTRAVEELRGFRTRAAAWQLEDDEGFDPLDTGVRRIYRQGRRRMRRAAAKRGGRMRTMHQWRKRVKDLRYVAEALERPAGPAASRSARSGARRMRRLARRADKLGEVLGEEHDLALLGLWIERHGSAAGAGGGTRRRLHRRIERRRAKLRRRALAQGRELYRRRPKPFVKRVAKASARDRRTFSRR